MLVPHTRKPSKMSPANYAIFAKQVKNYMADDSSAEGRPDHLVAQQATLADAYIAIHDAVNAAKNDQLDASEKASDLLNDIKEKLRWFQITLPTLTPGDDSILTQFGLQKPIPTKKAEIRDMGDSVNEQWQEVRAQAIYDPIRAEGDELATFLTEHEAQEDIQISMAQEYSQRQEEREVARKEHHVIERAIFNWYRGLHQDPYDSWWTNTPWGTASGGGDETPTELTGSATEIGPGVWDLWCSKPEDVVDAKVEMQELPDGPVKIVTEHMTIEEGVFVPFRLRDIPPGSYRVFFTAYDESGAQWGDVVAVKFTVEPY